MCNDRGSRPAQVLEMINNRQIQLIINDNAVNKGFWADAPVTKTRLSAAQLARPKTRRTSSQEAR
jgi:hypothetical protein